MNVDQDKLNELCDNVDLLEYAEKTMDFEKRGVDEYATHCPLHTDKTPSLMITPSRNLFYCHSCHVGGNIINWLMTFEHMRFNEAIDKIANLSGTTIDHLKTCDTVKIFKQLKRFEDEHKPQEIVREVLPESFLDRFSHDEYPHEWLSEGISPDVMDMYGVCIDKKSNRICYPIYSNDDELISVKGRTRFEGYKDLRLSKYISYFKIQTTNFLVGMKQNRQSILAAGSVVIFEGIKSGMKITSWGLGQCWLSAETSRLNQYQVEILLDMQLRDITIAFDRDVDIKSIRECTALLRKFTNVYVVRDRYNKKNRLLPGDKDSPVDAGKEIWLQLFSERKRL